MHQSTLSLEFGQLLAQRVVAVLQLSLLQLHVLHVVRQRADLCLVLKVRTQCLRCRKYTDEQKPVTNNYKNKMYFALSVEIDLLQAILNVDIPEGI